MVSNMDDRALASVGDSYIKFLLITSFVSTKSELLHAVNLIWKNAHSS